MGENISKSYRVCEFTSPRRAYTTGVESPSTKSHLSLYSPENTMVIARSPRPLFYEFDQLVDLFSEASKRVTYSSAPRISSEEKDVVIEVDTPGVSPSDVKVRIEGRSLVVETPRGNSYVSLGQRLASDEATASLKHGLLTIRIPKREAKIVEVVVQEP